MSLDGRLALVTGAARGIGQAIARRLAHDGAYVVGTATRAVGADAIEATLGPGRGQGQVLDVRDAAACEALVRTLVAERGPVGILVNNAGITRDGLMLRTSESDWQAVIDTDLTAAFRLSRLVLRGMLKARQGRIISIGSVVGAMGNPGQASYCAAKAGLAGFSRALAREIGSRGITVNVVSPGYIDTDMTRTMPEETRRALLGQVPAGRLGSGADIAAAVAFLASDGAGYVTGETMHVNGGLYMA